MSEQVGRGAGGFVGGIANNPGIVAIAAILGTIGLLLLFFQNDIRKAFEGFGQIQLPEITLPSLPDITFPTFEFPDITFPSFGDITFPEFPSFDFGNIFGGSQQEGTPVDIALAEGATPQDIEAMLTEEERLLDPNRDPNRFLPPDEFIGPTIEELFPDQPVSISDFINRFLSPAEQFAVEERGATPESLGITTFGEGPVIVPQMETLADPSPEIPFAVANVEETQTEFQERSGAFAEAFPGITESTSLPGGEIIFGEQLSRESEDFSETLAGEAARSESIFAALFGNVQNPDFGA